MASIRRSFEPTWAMIEALNGEEDRLLAHQVLIRDSSMVLPGPPRRVSSPTSEEHDTAWHDLVLTLTDPHQRVREVADVVLKGFVETGESRPVRWDPAREPLVALLDGTNAWATPTVLKVLAATEVDREFGRRLIRAAPELPLAYVGAEHEETRQTAIDLFRTVSGEDFGADPDAWSEWLGAPPDDS